MSYPQALLLIAIHIAAFSCYRRGSKIADAVITETLLFRFEEGLQAQQDGTSGLVGLMVETMGDSAVGIASDAGVSGSRCLRFVVSPRRRFDYAWVTLPGAGTRRIKATASTRTCSLERGKAFLFLSFVACQEPSLEDPKYGIATKVVSEALRATTDWTELSAEASVPSGLESVVVLMKVEGLSGEAFFDDLSIEVVR